jgi:hypothetical protein
MIVFQKFTHIIYLLAGAIGGLALLSVLLIFLQMNREKRRLTQRFNKNGGQLLKSIKIEIFPKEKLDGMTKNYTCIIGQGAFTTGIHASAVCASDTADHLLDTADHLPCTGTRQTCHGSDNDGRDHLPCAHVTWTRQRLLPRQLAPVVGTPSAVCLGVHGTVFAVITLCRVSGFDCQTRVDQRHSGTHASAVCLLYRALPRSTVCLCSVQRPFGPKVDAQVHRFMPRVRSAVCKCTAEDFRPLCRVPAHGKSPSFYLFYLFLFNPCIAKYIIFRKCNI